MKLKKGDKIFSGNPKGELGYDLIIGVVNKKYYALELYGRKTTRHKFKIGDLDLVKMRDYEQEIGIDESVIQRRK